MKLHKTSGVILLALSLVTACFQDVPTTRTLKVDGVDARIQIERDHSEDLPQMVRGFASTASTVLPELNADKPGSEVARLNQLGSAGRLALSRHVFRALDLGRAYSQLTDYAYDYTATPLAELWRQSAPDHRTLEEALQQTGMHHIEVSEPVSILLTASGVRIHPGDLAFAYALDAGVVELRQRANGAYAVMFPGMIRREGVFPADETPVLPIQLGREALGTLRLDTLVAAVARSPETRSVRAPSDPAAVLIDPRSGQPVRPAHLAVAAGPLATKALALAEALLITGAERGERLLARFPDYDVMMVPAAPTGTLWMTPGFKASFVASTQTTWRIQTFTGTERASPSR